MVARAGTGRNGNAQQAQAVAVRPVPFTAAAHEHVEPAFTATVTPGTAGVEHGPFDVPSSGYVRHILLEVTGTGGTLGAGVLSADYPWNLFERVTFADTNGSPIIELDGYALLWANIVGGYAFEQDPRTWASYVGTINAKFYLRIPLEINHFDGLGAISNQNSAAAYKVTLRTRTSAQLYSTAPTTPATFTIRGYLEAWTVPNETDLAGRPQSQKPPLHGTTQYWTSSSQSVLNGANTWRITRTGNMIRNILFICRDATGARVDTTFPDPITFVWDGNNLLQESKDGHLLRFEERINALSARDTGVFCWTFNHAELGRAGDGPANLWLPVVQGARLEIQGNTTAAGSVQIAINDVEPIEAEQARRYQVPSATGLQPSDNPAVGARGV